jgi:hypothetical protein
MLKEACPDRLQSDARASIRQEQRRGFTSQPEQKSIKESGASLNGPWLRRISYECIVQYVSESPTWTKPPPCHYCRYGVLQNLRYFLLTLDRKSPPLLPVHLFLMTWLAHGLPRATSPQLQLLFNSERHAFSPPEGLEGLDGLVGLVTGDTAMGEEAGELTGDDTGDDTGEDTGELTGDAAGATGAVGDPAGDEIGLAAGGLAAGLAAGGDATGEAAEGEETGDAAGVTVGAGVVCAETMERCSPSLLRHSDRTRTGSSCRRVNLICNISERYEEGRSNGVLSHDGRQERSSERSSWSVVGLVVHSRPDRRRRPCRAVVENIRALPGSTRPLLLRTLRMEQSSGKGRP